MKESLRNMKVKSHSLLLSSQLYTPPKDSIHISNKRAERAERAQRDPLAIGHNNTHRAKC